MAALSMLLTAYPKRMSDIEKVSVKKLSAIINSLVEKLPLELRNACCDVLSTRTYRPSPSQITQFIGKHLDAEVHKSRLRKNEYSPPELLDLIPISHSIETLAKSFAHDRVLVPCLQQSLPLSPVELFRIQRSFWRFQLCYDMCHPEDSASSRKRNDAEWRSLERYVQHPAQVHQTSASVPNWLQCRGPRHCPEALSSFLPNLCEWEQDELEAVRFHLEHEVNKLQHSRSCGAKDDLAQQPSLLQRLIRDIDLWDDNNPKDHVLVASFRQNLFIKDDETVWNRRRDHFEASSANTNLSRFMQYWQNGHAQWGWRVWDEGRLVGRGLLDPDFDRSPIYQRIGHDELAVAAQTGEWRAAKVRAHGECVESQYKDLDRQIAIKYDHDVRKWAEGRE